MSPEVLVMSQTAWASLSTEDRKIFREAAIRSSQFMREKWKDLEDRSRERAKAAGVTIGPISTANPLKPRWRESAQRRNAIRRRPN
jgi:TRAP-type C4-dicarboxylate transport system substrate-binding protein